MNGIIKKYYYLAILQDFNKISMRQRKFHSAVDERLYFICILYRNKYVNKILHLLFLITVKSCDSINKNNMSSHVILFKCI